MNMGSTRGIQEKKVVELTRKTKLARQVVESLVERYNCHCKDGKGLERDTMKADFMIEFDILDAFIQDRIFRVFDASASGNYLKLDDYVTGMSTFLTTNLDEQIKFAFKVYDLNGDQYITREEMYQFLKYCMVEKYHAEAEDDADESPKDLTEIILKKLSSSNDNRVSLEDFRTAVMSDKLLLESLGQCLPTEKRRCKYLQILGDPEMRMNQTPTVMIQRRQKRPPSHSQKKHICRKNNYSQVKQVS